MTIFPTIKNALKITLLATSLASLALASPATAKGIQSHAENSVNHYEQARTKELPMYVVVPSDGSDRIPMTHHIVTEEPDEIVADEYVMAGHTVIVAVESEDGTKLLVAVAETGRMGWIERINVDEN